MKNIYKVFAIILVLLASAQSAFAQKAFLLEPDATVNVNDSVVIRLNDYEGTIQWQKSLNLQLWDNIPEATHDTLLFVANTTSYFRAEVIAGDCDPFYSDTTMVKVLFVGEWPTDTITEVVEVLNPATGKIWMDRNLGASRAATSSTDAEAYGHLYQWGRAADGHQVRTSSTTTTLSSSDTPGHGDFILSSSSENWDWRSPQNNNLWQGVNGINNPCPAGYRLPTEAELNAERDSWSINNDAGAFASPLKLTLAGYRSYSDGSLADVESLGIYSSRTVVGYYSRGLSFSSYGAGMNVNNRADGLSVRCFKDSETTIYTLTLQVSPEGSGQVTGASNYAEGTIVTITATPNENYQFVNWTGDTDHLADATSASTTLTMPAQDVNLTANFETNEEPGAGVTDIDGNFYPSVIIGDQEWMAENLKTTKFADGSAIDFGINIDSGENTTTPAYAIYNYPIGELTSEEIFNMFGALYNWPAVNDPRGLCPAGWQVPSQTDWNQLISHLTSSYELHNDMYSSNVSGAGNALKSCRQINSPLGGDCNTTQHPRWNANSTHYGNNLVGFNALPGGTISDLAHSMALESAWWWSATSENTDQAKTYYLYIETGALVNSNSPKINGLSIRCIKTE